MKSALTVLLCILITSTGFASSVEQVGFDRIARSSQLIFEGTVIDKESRFAANGDIYTYVTFMVMDLIKGRHADRYVVLRYLGGTVGDLSLRVSDLVPPDIGERGIYFVESMTAPPPHPLFGWDQGHFLVRIGSDGAYHIFNRKGAAIQEFSPAKASTASGLSSGTAAGLVVESGGRSPGLTVSEFKRLITEIAN